MLMHGKMMMIALVDNSLNVLVHTLIKKCVTFCLIACNLERWLLERRWRYVFITYFIICLSVCRERWWWSYPIFDKRYGYILYCMSIPWLESDDLFVKVQLYLSADDPTYFQSPTWWKSVKHFIAMFLLIKRMKQDDLSFPFGWSFLFH